MTTLGQPSVPTRRYRRRSASELPRRLQLPLAAAPTRKAVSWALAIVLVGSLVAPDPAQAFLGIDPAGWAVDGFKAIIKWIFGDVSTLANHMVQFLLGVPLLADPGQFPKLNAYRDYVVYGAWGVLSLSFVISSLRYWLSSYSGSGAHEALIGFARTAGAIVLLLVFRTMFDQLIRFVNEFTSALITNSVVGGALGDSITTTLTGALATGSGGIGMIVGIAALIMAIVLVVIKVIATALLAVLFVLFALAVSLWPIEELSWALRNAVQAILALLMFPIIWAVCFGTFAVLSVDTLFGEGGSLVNSLLGPLYTLAALIVAFRLPFVVLRQAMNAGLAPSISKGLQTAHYARALMK